MRSLKFVPYNRLGVTANIIVDSVPIESTVLTLSHWPASGSPPELKADLSAEIVFNFLESDYPRPDAEAISNKHFDEDGLVGLFALLNPQIAAEEKDFLIDVATAGDFGTYKNREAAHVAFVLQAWTQPAQSPLNSGVFQRPYDEVTSILYEELLPRFSNLFQRVHFLEQYWKDEDALLEWSENAIARGEIVIEEHPELDFAIVISPGSKEWVAARPRLAGARWTHQVCHQYAVHNATNCSRILVSDGKRHDFYYRYETWVELVQRKPLSRIDLKALAARLNAGENKKIWRAEGIEDIVPHLSADARATTKLSTAAVKGAFMEFFSLST
jgi:hypothetical protein